MGCWGLFQKPERDPEQVGNGEHDNYDYHDAAGDGVDGEADSESEAKDPDGDQELGDVQDWDVDPGHWLGS